jgi:hypothetical protein
LSWEGGEAGTEEGEESWSWSWSFCGGREVGRRHREAEGRAASWAPPLYLPSPAATTVEAEVEDDDPCAERTGGTRRGLGSSSKGGSRGVAAKRPPPPRSATDTLLRRAPVRAPQLRLRACCVPTPHAPTAAAGAHVTAPVRRHHRQPRHRPRHA